MTAVTARPTTTSTLWVEGLSKDYGDVRAVANVSFKLEPGTFYALLGPSGCGKTTLLKLLAGFEEPTGGDIYLDGRSIASVPAFRRPLNTVFQHYALFPHMDVARNVGYALRQQRPRLPKAEVEQRVDDALAMVQLAHLSRRRSWELSGGQQQRVALARALVARPQVLLLDEPLSALDAKLRVDMQGELKSLQEQLGISFVFVTHDQSEALSMADRIAVMRAGEIVQDALPRDLYDSPADTWVAGFIGSMNVAAGTVSGLDGSNVRVRVGGREYTGVPTVAGLTPGAPAHFAIRPERVRMVAGDTDLHTDSRTEGTIRALRFRGDQIDYTIDTPGLGDIKVRVALGSVWDDPDLRPGASVALGWNRLDARVVPTWSPTPADKET